jgi:hypothetical protein
VLDLRPHDFFNEGPIAPDRKDDQTCVRPQINPLQGLSQAPAPRSVVDYDENLVDREWSARDSQNGYVRPQREARSGFTLEVVPPTVESDSCRHNGEVMIGHEGNETGPHATGFSSVDGLGAVFAPGLFLEIPNGAAFRIAHHAWIDILAETSPEVAQVRSPGRFGGAKRFEAGERRQPSSGVAGEIESCRRRSVLHSTSQKAAYDTSELRRRRAIRCGRIVD